MNVVSGGNLKLRLEASASGLDMLWQDQFVVCAEGVRPVFFWEEHAGCPAKESCAPWCLVHLLHRAGFRCFVQGHGCSVVCALLLWVRHL